MDDLISRQEAIDLFLDKGMITAAIYVERLASAQPESIEQIRWERDTAIQQLADLGYGLGEKPRTDGDTISRQAAIDAICKHGTELERRNITVLAVVNHKQVTVDLLETVPAVQSEIIRCKDCLMHGVCRFEQGLGLDGYCSQAERKVK